ncbi:unnamed protein product [Aphanomyces euteiches]
MSGSIPSGCPFPVNNYAARETVAFDPAKLDGHTLRDDGQDQPAADESHRSADQVWKEAYEFLHEYYRDCHPDGLQGLPARAAAVQASILATGTYFQTRDELEYGVRLSWRNASRCIMRVQWKNIQLIDARGPDEHRQVTSKEIFERCVEHLEKAVSTDADGNRIISSYMTVFPQLLPVQESGNCKIWNSQLLRFAGYLQPDGSVLGDPDSVELTEAAIHLGWTPPLHKSPFDFLPLVAQGNVRGSAPIVADYPERVKVVVDITHPEYPAMAELKLRWFAVPAISNFCLDVGGLQYPCSPFNGWFMDSEVASRNLADVQRYNVLEDVGRALRLDVRAPRAQWQDRAALELNAAVLHSFQRQQLTIVDHHTASDSFVRHHAKEMQTRGFCPADWVWLTPPIGGATTSIFHQEMVNFCIKPTFLTPDHTIIHLSEHPKNAKGHAASNHSTRPVRIYYGSETGNCEAFAQALHKTLDPLHVVAFGPLNDCDLAVLAADQTKSSLVVVTSTFGAGGPPANAKTFCDRLASFQGDLSHVQAYVFGLGSTNYASFNACAIAIAAHLKRVRAVLAVQGVGDETKDSVGAFESFVSNVAKDHDLLLPQHKTNKVSVEWSPTPLGSTTLPAADLIFQGRLLPPVPLTTNVHREAIEYSFAVPPSTVSYAEGDDVAVLCENDPQTVAAVHEALKLNGDLYVKHSNEYAPVFLKGGYTWRDILRDHVDLSGPVSLAFTQLAAEYASSGTEAKIELQFYSSEASHAKWIHETATSVGDFLVKFAAVVNKMPFEELVLLLPRLTPWLYSISSSPNMDKDTIAITIRMAYISAAHNARPPRRGVCSDYLATRPPNATVRLYVSSCPMFRLDPVRPTIWIANGTGIAPFRSFWRAAKPADAPPRVFYYGCRDPTDFLYRDEAKPGVDHMAVAFSRSPSHPKQHIDDILLADAERLSLSLLSAPSKGAAANVRKALEQVVKHVHVIDAMVQKGLCVEDVF